IGISLLGREIDLLYTYYITPHLKLETNWLIRRLGWKGSIILQIPLILLGTFFRELAIFILAWSIIVASSNISGAWFVRNLPEGDEKYFELLKTSARRAKFRYIILDESPPLVLFVIPNVLIWIWIHLEVGNVFYLLFQGTLISYVLIITAAFILHGSMSFVRNLLYVSRLKREKSQGPPKIKDPNAS
ncbi:MAG: hypothetical protein LUQ65_07775, partial [Candidatus Helarchaeota archaeon]|nr:hypothetical protein [Candidatus Helarchaeota archaeon]